MGHTVRSPAPVYVAACSRTTWRATIRARNTRGAPSSTRGWYVVRPHGHAGRRRCAAGETDHGESRIALRSLRASGTAPTGWALVVEDVLLVATTCAPCENPFVDDARAYRATLLRLLGCAGVREVTPPRPGCPRRRDRDRARRPRYPRAPARGAALDRALSVPLPRAADVPGMSDSPSRHCARARGAPSDARPGSGIRSSRTARPVASRDITVALATATPVVAVYRCACIEHYSQSDQRIRFLLPVPVGQPLTQRSFLSGTRRLAWQRSQGRRGDALPAVNAAQDGAQKNEGS